uniref:Uncharacterized protein n=1 Tax=Clastoptera arizonana TaxID=38151 RepID=A0A1B6CFV6_9HEMI
MVFIILMLFSFGMGLDVEDVRTSELGKIYGGFPVCVRNETEKVERINEARITLVEEVEECMKLIRKKDLEVEETYEQIKKIAESERKFLALVLETFKKNEFNLKEVYYRVKKAIQDIEWFQLVKEKQLSKQKKARLEIVREQFNLVKRQVFSAQVTRHPLIVEGMLTKIIKEYDNFVLDIPL